MNGASTLWLQAGQLTVAKALRNAAARDIPNCRDWAEGSGGHTLQGEAIYRRAARSAPYDDATTALASTRQRLEQQLATPRDTPGGRGDRLPIASARPAPGARALAAIARAGILHIPHNLLG